LGIAFPTEGLYSKDTYTIKLIELILNGSMSSRLFVRLREKQGLVYSITSNTTNYQEGGVFFTITSFDKDKLEKVLRSLLNEFILLQTKKISEAELNRWKNYIRSSMIMDVENTMDVADYYAREMLFNRKKIVSFPELISKYTEPTVKDIMRVSKKLFDWRHMKLVLIGDYSQNGKQIVENIMRIIKETYAK
jgi:predicted Zn-dependent peptidase